MEPQSRNIAGKMESTAKAIYEKMKHECATYGELKEKILAVSKHISWKNPEMGTFLETTLLDFWEKEAGSLPVQGQAAQD